MKKIKLLTKILAIAIICLVGFVGIYLPLKNPIDMNNLVKDFNLSKDLKGYREILLKTEETEGENLNAENYEKSKDIIEKRLNELDVQDYNLSVDKKSGNIYLQIPENDKTDKVLGNIVSTGTIELKDSNDDTKTFLTNENLNKAAAFYQTLEKGTSVYLELQFNDEGKETLKNLSENDYKTLPKETEKKEDTDNKEESKNKDSEKQEQKEVALYISGSKATTMSFDKPVTDGKLQLSIGSKSTDEAKVNENLANARNYAIIFNNGPLPVKYTVSENQFVKSEIKQSSLNSVAIVVAAVFGILIVYMAIKYKARGVLSAISYIGFTALYILALRQFNVIISLEAILGGIFVLVLNYLVCIKLLKITDGKKQYYKAYLDIIMKLLPIFALSIIFVYMPIVALSSLGMVMFWGIALVLAYNVTVTKYLVD